MTTTLAPTAVHRGSRLWSILTILGTVAVVVAFIIAGQQLTVAAAAVTALRRTADTLTSQVDSLKRETAGLREALTAARAGINAFHAGDYLGAVGQYDKVIRDDSSNAYLLNLRAYSLFKAGRIDEAIRSQQLSLRADPGYAWGYFDLARFECARGNWDAAKDALVLLKKAVSSLSSVQGKVGAGQNNLAQAIDLANSQLSNFQAAESAIRDADVSAEASNLSRLTTLQQAGVAALAQANQTSQAVLSLLR